MNKVKELLVKLKNKVLEVVEKLKVVFGLKPEETPMQVFERLLESHHRNGGLNSQFSQGALLATEPLKYSEKYANIYELGSKVPAEYVTITGFDAPNPLVDAVCIGQMITDEKRKKKSKKSSKSKKKSKKTSKKSKKTKKKQ